MTKTIERSQLNEQFIKECRARLVEMKMDLLNRSRSAMREYEQRDRGGSEDGTSSVRWKHRHPQAG